MVILMVMVVFAISVGGKKYAKFRGLLFRNALYNKYIDKNKAGSFEINSLHFEIYHKNTFKRAAFFCFGFIIIMFIIFAIPTESSSDGCTCLFVAFLAVCFGYPFYEYSFLSHRIKPPKKKKLKLMKGG